MQCAICCAWPAIVNGYFKGRHCRRQAGAIRLHGCIVTSHARIRVGVLSVRWRRQLALLDRERACLWLRECFNEQVDALPG